MKKLYLALPMAGQFEQAINAVFLEKLNCGVNLQKPDRQGIEDFFGRLPVFEAALSKLPGFDNQPLLAALDGLLADECQGARSYQQRRKQLNTPPDRQR